MDANKLSSFIEVLSTELIKIIMSSLEKQDISIEHKNIIAFESTGLLCAKIICVIASSLIDENQTEDFCKESQQIIIGTFKTALNELKKRIPKARESMHVKYSTTIN